MTNQVKFEGKSFNIAGLQEVSATQQITTPVMFEFEVTGLAKAYNYGQAVFLGNRQQDLALIKIANTERTKTIDMVAKYLQLPVSQQISDFTNHLYDQSFYRNTTMQTALDALSNGMAIQNIFDSTTLQNIQDNFKSQLAAKGWQVQYFQIDQIIIINGPGGDIPSTYQFIDGASWLVSAVPLSNAVPLQFEASTTFGSRYGDLGPVDAVIIAMVIIGAIATIIAFTELVIVIKNALVAIANALGKNAPQVVTSVAVTGAIAVGVVLAIMLVIGHFKNPKKSNSSTAGGGGT